jgi:hypothetical protein
MLRQKLFEFESPYSSLRAVVGLAWSNDPESYAGQVKGDDPDIKG